MEFNKILQELEYTTKQALSYYLLALKKDVKVTKIADYISAVVETVESIGQTEVINKIDINLISEFPFYHSINNAELLSYAIVVFDNLLKQNREIKENDIVKELEIVMKLYSSRIILDKAKEILSKMKNL